MKDFGVFDVLGPVMIGPSSSHTAGAARLGKIAKDIIDSDFDEVIFYLHGSFAKTYEGHGTDKALVAGVLGLSPCDENLRDSFKLAKEKGLKYSFIEKDLGYVHPNTVKMVFKTKDKEDVYIIGSSIGGGNILITDINGNKIEFRGAYPTLLLKYKEQPGVVARISSIISNNNINIATMKVTREKDVATMVIETDSILSEDILLEIDKFQDIIYKKVINPTKGWYFV